GLIASKDSMGLFTDKVGFIQGYKNTLLNEAYRRLRRHDIHRIPNIKLFKKWRIKSKTWRKHKSIRSYIVLSQLNNVKDAFERERLRQICNGDTRFLKIKNVRKIDIDEMYVYDISTKPYERFVCSNILVHNTDFLNMKDQQRLKSKKISKTQSVTSQLDAPINPEDIHVGPSDYVPWLKDKKICFIRMEGRKFGDVPLEVELRLDVEDSPNSAGVMVDAIRCCKLALDRKTGGTLLSPSSYFMKSPMEQYTDTEARKRVEEFIKGERER
ncbi:MAG: hypothetical protein FJY77_04400, partial [Candidatus Altiarchaeales archaeon]|nr:hypothetical protein [Candidatus Altiarchaeales archaeon]